MNVAIFGIGNVLAHDDAVGPTVVRMLEAEWLLPVGVTVEDLGTPVLELPAHLAGWDAVILVDAVSASAPPGTILVYERDQILAHPPGLRLSPHDPALRETLMTLQLVGTAPKEIILVGVVPEITGMGIGLSDVVKAALPLAAEQVVAEIAARFGIYAERRDEARDADIWWAA
jgi:hydrogenase maturation protease